MGLQFFCRGQVQIGIIDSYFASFYLSGRIVKLAKFIMLRCLANDGVVGITCQLLGDKARTKNRCNSDKPKPSE